jgi:hypothetical protein
LFHISRLMEALKGFKCQVANNRMARDNVQTVWTEDSCPKD